MTTQRGQFIVFEGIDGSGKSTQSQMLSDYLVSKGRKVHMTRQPSDRFVGKAIREVLEKRQVVPPQSLAAMFLADRYDHILGEGGILSYLESGVDVICDRYFWSSFAYHGLDMEIPFVIDLHKEIFELLMPDITFFIDLKPADAIARIAKRSAQRDLFEKESLLTTIRQNYIFAFEQFADTKIVKIDGNQSLEKVHGDLVREL